MSQRHTSSNYSEKIKQMYISLAGTDQCNSTLSRNIQFGKDIQLLFSPFQKIYKEI